MCDRGEEKSSGGKWMEGEQQTELDFDLGEGKMRLERAPAVTSIGCRV